MYIVLGLIVLAFPMFATIENIIGSVIIKIRVIWNFLGLCLASAFVLILLVYVSDKNMISYPWAVFYGMGGLCVLYSFFERGGGAVLAKHGGQAMNMMMQKGLSMMAGQSRKKGTTLTEKTQKRFLLPISTQLLSASVTSAPGADHSMAGNMMMTVKQD